MPNHSESVEDYLKTIWSLCDEGKSVGTVEVARVLNVSPASVSGMIKRLAARGFVSHRPYHGVLLTKSGRKLALNVVRRHRLIETFLARVLEIPDPDVHAEAERWEHVVSDAVVERMDALLGFPVYDPHGAPIPDAQGRLPRRSRSQEEPS